MQRKATKNTRGANAEEKRFHAYTKECPCVVCGNPAPSIVHHAMGATYRHNKVLIGHWFVLPLCQTCDDVITYGSRRKFREQFGLQSEYWQIHHASYLVQNINNGAPFEVIQSINTCGE